ncbi:MAG: 1-acyl-sn-glycerol-3-phosphate acyltransferase [Spirochaetaceae bacterium]|jgi:glycerol-3-phosphate O-acyltransferase|nr:1-acyl-sn-glycerol-3-phosphate acyltransferase [Spirochaetaceae bacterium]
MTVADFKEQIEEMHKNLTGDYTFSSANVYRQGNHENRQIIGAVLDQVMLPGSEIQNKENLQELYNYSKQGKACLLLVEHYSNFDYPGLYRLVEKDEELGPEIAKSMLPLQGMKLSEGSRITSAFTRSYETIIIYPSRSIDQVSDPEEKKRIQEISVPINHAAIKELTHRKHHGRIILVFPAGTRYRPWVPDSRKGVREIFSYLKTFDYVSFISINGNTLKPSESEDMSQDKLSKDVLLFTVSKPLRARTIRKEWQETAPEGSDSRQHVVDKVMETLLEMNTKNEPIQNERLKKLS